MDIKVGDEVRVFDINGGRMGQPNGGWVGIVTRVGRKLFTVDHPNAGWRNDGTRGDDFRFDSMRKNDKQWGFHTWVRTLGQVALDQRWSNATQAMKAHGFRLETADRTLSLVQLEELVCMLPVIQE